MHPTVLIQLVEEHAVTMRANAAEHRLIKLLRTDRSRRISSWRWRPSPIYVT
jgi:hypothetical protein